MDQNGVSAFQPAYRKSFVVQVVDVILSGGVMVKVPMIHMHFI
jgi:hypothetical protein